VSSRNAEQERLTRDGLRAGFVEVDANVWVRASQIEMVRAAADTVHEREAAGVVSLIGYDEVFLTRLTPAQLLRAIVAVQGRDTG
jgi:hypothetical protein